MAGTIRIAILADAAQAKRELSGIADTTQKSGKKMAAFHKIGNAAGLALAGGLVVAGKAAVDFTKKAAADAQGASRLAQTLHRTTGATKGQQAAVEDWISAQEKAFGVSDDDLRPALSKLAVATGSVTKAQKLATLAMDISAGSGKSLESVSFALAKAQNGNVAGLARLGVKTTSTTKDTGALERALTGVKSAQLSYTTAVKNYGKDSAQAHIAADKLKQAHEAVGAAQEKTKKTTLSLDQITKSLSKQYGGAAAKNAKTAAGQQKILSVEYQELQEQIGAGLLPVMTKLTSVGLKATDWISKHTKVVGIAVGVVASLVAITWGVNAAISAWTAVTKLAAGIQIVFTNAQWALNAAMTANPIGLVVVAVIALVAAFVIAYKKSETFRNIVQGALAAVGVAAKALKDAFTASISAIVKVVGSVAHKIAAVLKPVINAYTLPYRIAFRVAKDLVTGNIGDIVGLVRGIPGKLLGLAKLFGTAGKGLIHAFVDGMKNAAGIVSGIAGNVWDALRGLLNGAIDKINSALEFNISVGFGKHVSINPPDIPHLAKGTDFFSGGLALVGEKGPELVQLPRGSKVIPNDRLRGASTHNIAPAVTYVTVNVTAPVGADGYTIGETIKGYLDTYMAGVPA